MMASSSPGTVCPSSSGHSDFHVRYAVQSKSTERSSGEKMQEGEEDDEDESSGYGKQLDGVLLRDKKKPVVDNDVKQEKQGNVIQGFDTLDGIQRYAVGALSMVFLGDKDDLNHVAFARDYVLRLFAGLDLKESQTSALLALSPEEKVREDVARQCVELIGDKASRFHAVQAMLALAVSGGVYDSRARAFLMRVAEVFEIPWERIAAVELAVAVSLLKGADAIEAEKKKGKTAAEYLNARRRKKKKIHAVAKVGGITLAGGILFGLTGGLIAPALLASLAGIGLTGAAGLAATGTVASGAVVGSLFGVAGAGLTGRKARKRMGMKVSDFRFERADDPRVLYQEQFNEQKNQSLLKQRSESHGSRISTLNSTASPDDKDVKWENTNSGVNTLASPALFATPEDISDTRRFTDDGPGTHSDLDTQVSLASFSHSSPASNSGMISIENDSGPEHAGKNKRVWRSSDNKSTELDEADPITMNSKEFHDQQHYGGLTRPSMSNPSLHLVITVPAWLDSRRAGSALKQFTCAHSELPFAQHVSLRWEARRLHQMSQAFAKFWASKATVTTIQQAYPHMVAAASSVAGAVAFAIALPLTVISCLDYIDNPWSVLVSRSNGAGEQLADELTLRAYGNRPVTLIGYSLGARVIFKALESLAARNAIGIVADVFLVGAPVSADPARWDAISKIVAGRIMNGYCSCDWALAYFHRGCGHGIYVAGLRRVESKAVINMNMAFLGVGGHRWLKDAMGRAIKAMGVATGKIEMPPAPLIVRGTKKESELEDDDEVVAATEHEDVDEVPNFEGKFETSSSSEISGNGMVENPGSGNTGRQGKKKRWGGAKNLVAKEDSNGMTGQMASSGSKSNGKSWFWSAWTRSRRKTSKERKASSPPRATEDDDDIPDVVSFKEFYEADKNRSTAPSNIFSPERRALDDSENAEEPKEHGPGEFDWELQKRLWAEQERSLLYDPSGQTALNLTVEDLAPSAAVLNLGIEITGRRLRTFITQDTPFPASHTEVFSNCIDEQKSLVVGIYEYMPSSKTLALSLEKLCSENQYFSGDEDDNVPQEESHTEDDVGASSNGVPISTYPKLLEELRIEWHDCQPKGSMRFSVTLECSEDGVLSVSVTQLLEDGKVGGTAETVVTRDRLCSLRERKILEEREKRKQSKKSKSQKMIESEDNEVLALPGPETEEPSSLTTLGVEQNVSERPPQDSNDNAEPGVDDEDWWNRAIEKHQKEAFG